MRIPGVGPVTASHSAISIHPPDEGADSADGLDDAARDDLSREIGCNSGATVISNHLAHNS